ncbi:glycine cleavage system aminomethyltransferase GcvT [Corynebacterium hansenii]|uniref:Aminomethyltransferase n=1 Tax=Corynebacterium hansenii TaxID=394964 RepID=A0ABV7ZMQ9_9CORY|nr:glycine cleavage system aminomethyltransferase GcvT [Corynebacterium hansenii]WJY98707.1 Aminomethyltransferase [Corynebacterium hansenii]
MSDANTTPQATPEGAGQASPEETGRATTKVTALHDLHAELGARFTDFGGWDMPLRYGKELEEHRAVRESAGVFDLSHMGEVRITGPDAAAFLDHALISRISAVAVGKAKYSMICDADGGIIDDLIVYRLGDEEFLVVPNAGNAPTVVAELHSRRGGGAFDCAIADETLETALIAVQGPRAEEIVAAVVVPAGGLDGDSDAAATSDGASGDAAPTVAGLGYYAALPGVIRAGDGAGEGGPGDGTDIPVLLARTGYTGEDGFEIFVANDGARATWDAVMAAAAQLGAGAADGSGDSDGRADSDGSGDGLPVAVPCGLASRDTLRLEAGMPLYGNELSREVTPVDAGLGILAATKSKPDFVGRDAIVEAKQSGPAKVLIALAGEGRRAARAGYPLVDADGTAIGEVTSGALSPTLGHPIALAYVDAEAGIAAGLLAADDPAKPTPIEGAAVSVDVRGKALPYVVVKPPFYTRP